MKKRYSLIAALLFSAVLSAQNVGIGTATPNASAKLDIVDANRGILLPRVALTSTTVAAPVSTPANWLVVFNTQNINDVTEGMYYWNGTRWVRLSTTNDAWQLRGNAGTNPATNFVGTTDAQDLVFRRNNQEILRVVTTGTQFPYDRAYSYNTGGYGNLGETVNGLGTILGNNIVPSASLPDFVVRGTATSLPTAAVDAGNFIKLQYNKGITFHTGVSSAAGTAVTADINERMRIANNGNVGVGTNNPASQFIVLNNLALGVNRGIWASSHDNARAGVVLGFRKSRGTEAAPTSVADTDYSACMISHNYDGSSYQINSYVGYRITGTPTAGSVPGQIFFAANNANTSDPYNDNTVRMVINNNGNVGIGTTAPATLVATRPGSMVLGQGSPDYAELTGGAGFGANLALRWATNGNINSFVSGNNTSYFNVQTGNVGVGIAAPIDKFQVGNGNARIGEVNPVNGASTYPNSGRALYFSGGQGNSWDSENSDPIILQRYNVASDQTDLQIIIGDNVTPNNDRLTIGNLANGQKIALSASGHVGINTLSPAANLDIVGNMKLTDGTQGAYKKLTSDAAGVARWEAAPSDVTANDVSLAVISGTATNLYTANQVLAKGTYLVYFYNCIAASSANYYLSAGPELLSGAATINQPFIWEWNQNKYYTTIPSVLKIQSATATVRGRVRHETGGTVTENPASCSGFYFVRIGD